MVLQRERGGALIKLSNLGTLFKPSFPGELQNLNSVDSSIGRESKKRLSVNNLWNYFLSLTCHLKRLIVLKKSAMALSLIRIKIRSQFRRKLGSGLP